MTNLREAFIANVPDADLRREADALYSAFNKAEDELYFAESRRDPDTERVREKRDAAWKAWNDLECPDVARDFDTGDTSYCALTELVIFDEDAILFDHNTGEQILKAALGVPLDDEMSFSTAALLGDVEPEVAA